MILVDTSVLIDFFFTMTGILNTWLPSLASSYIRFKCVFVTSFEDAVHACSHSKDTMSLFSFENSIPMRNMFLPSPMYFSK